MSMNGDESRALPVFPAGLDAAAATLQGGDEFWPDVERLTEGDLARSLDDALAGAAAPRVWLFVHEPGQPQLGVIAALTCARALGARDQAAIVLDGDDRTTVLSRWSGREDAEGWIDMVRYGTSVLTSGVALPFAGRTAYLLGVGSYAPTDITGEEVDDLLGRLRRQADDLLIVCPLPGAALWARHADITLLCVDRQTRPAARIAELGEELAAAGARPGGVVGYGEPMAEPTVEPTVEPTGEPVADGPAGPDGDEMADLPPVDDLFAETDAAGGDDRADEAGGGVAAALAEADPADPADSFEVEGATRRSTSGVFWIAAVVSLVLIAVVAIYYFKFLRTGDDGFETGPVVTEVGPSDPGQAAADPQEPATGPAAGREDPATPAVAQADSQAAAPAGTDATADMGPEAEPVAADVAASGPEDAAAGDTGDGDGAPATATPATSGAQEPAAAETPAGEPAAHDPFTDPVGRDGWALWVYSFPDSSGAARQLALLERRGITAVERIVEIGGKGRWHRIYMGSFTDRGAARAATPDLLARLRTDWAQPVRFYASDND